MSVEEQFRSQVQKGWRIRDFIESYLASEGEDSSSSRILFEIGSGAGGILLPFKEKGWTVYGCDFDERYLDFGRSHSLNLKQGGLEELSELDVKPDIIILSHILEHIPDLDVFIENLKVLFKDDTILFIEVPGLFDLKYRYANDFLMYLQNAHLYHFTLETLSTLMIENGFRLLAGDEYVRALFGSVSKDDIRSGIGPVALDSGRKGSNISDEIIKYLANLETKTGRLLSKLLVLLRNNLETKMGRVLSKLLALFRLVTRISRRLVQ